VSLILVDGSALIYRAYYAFAKRPLTAPSGEQTSVAFGFFNSVLGLIDTYRPASLCFFFDLPGKTFRHDIFPEYKANRKPMPEELAEQIPRLRELLDAWGVEVLERPGYEADDLIGTVARLSDGISDRACLYSGDKDFLQLLDERTVLLKPGRRGDGVSEYTADDVSRDFDLQPADLVDVFALSGDKSDNIPGAPGVGGKTAIKLIRQFGSLENLYEQLEDKRLTPRLQRVLAESREQVFLSRDLFRIDREVPVTVDWAALQTHLPSGDQVTALLRHLGLRRVISYTERLARREQGARAGGTAAPRPPEGDDSATTLAPAVTEPEPAGPAADEEELARRGYLICTTESELSDYLAGLPEAAPLAVDTETDGLRVDRARLVGISLASPGRPAAYIPVLHRAGGADTEEPAAGELFAREDLESELSWVRARLAPVLADSGRLKIGQNLKFDEWILSRHGLPIAGPRFDTMVAAYVLDPGRQRYNLEELAAEHLAMRKISYAALFAEGDRQKDILGVPLPRLALYAAEDADVTLRLYEKMTPALAAAGLDRLFNDIEMPLSAVLFAMEFSGIKIDLAFLASLGDRFRAQLQELEEQIHDLAGEPFNVQSPRQLSHILFEKLALKPVRKTATGWSTDVGVLTALAASHPLPAKVLEYRQLAKLQNTYIDSLPELVNPETGLIHTSFNQAVAATGRLSSSDPNLQNIPVRSETGRLIRQAFVPRSAENVFLSADYSQIELRLLAHLCGDARLTRAFQEGGDIHRRTAARIAGVPETKVTAEMRSRAKAINFGVIYGMGAVALGKQISVPTKEAKAFIETYFATYPGVREFIDRTKEDARQNGYVQTLLGRKRPLPDILARNNRIRSFQERIAVNTPIQGTAADLIKLAMIRIARDLRGQGLEGKLLLQVHDELVLEVPRAELERVSELVKNRMETVLPLDVPLTVDLHVGRNWAEAHG